MIDLRGKDIKIQLDNSEVISAKVKTTVPLSIGDRASFVVEKISPSKISLKVIDNQRSTSQEALIDKALDELQVPKSDRTTSIVRELMNNQLAINKTMIQNLLKQSATFKNASISTLVLMNKYNMEMNEVSTTQFEAYRNNEHQLMNGISSLTEHLMQTFQSLSPEEAESFHNMLLKFLQNTTSKSTTSDTGSAVTPPSLLSNPSAVDSNNLTLELVNSSLEDGMIGLRGTTNNMVDPISTYDTMSLKNIGNKVQILEQNLTANMDVQKELDSTWYTMHNLPSSSNIEGTPIVDTSTLITEHPSNSEITNGTIGHILSPPMREELLESLSKFSFSNEMKESLRNGSMPTNDFIHNIKASIDSQHNIYPQHNSAVMGLLTSEPYQQILKESLILKWSISPKSLKENKGIHNFYKNIETDLEELKSYIAKLNEEEAQNTFQNAGKLTQHLKDNIDFMKSLNELFTYVQLPMKLSKQNAHTELFVYTNKKNLANSSDHVSVLLHLNMEHLGPLDIHLDLIKNHVASKIYVEDPISQNLIHSHINQLSDALRDKGYTLSYDIQKRERPVDIVKDLIQRDEPNTDMKRYTFDIRA